MTLDLNMSHVKMSGFVWVHFSHETEKFSKSLKYFNAFLSKKQKCQI